MAQQFVFQTKPPSSKMKAAKSDVLRGQLRLALTKAKKQVTFTVNRTKIISS
jgi:hypothetical protein